MKRLLVLLPALAASAEDRWFASYQLNLNLTMGGTTKEIALFGSQLQFAVKRYLNNGAPPPLDQTWMVISLPPEYQFGIAEECPGLLAASHLLAAISTLYTNPGKAMELATMATDYASLTPRVHLRGWEYNKLLGKFDETRMKVGGLLDRGPPSVGLVVSHCDEDLSWLHTINVPEGSSLRILEKCGMETDVEALIMGGGGRFADVERTHLPNLAMESLGYATFLARTPQADIRDYTVFLQGDPHHHLLHPGILDLSLQSLNTGTYDVPFLHLNGMRFLSGGSVCGEELREFLLVARAFPQTEFIDVELSPDDWPAMGTYCCSQFIVRRDRIVKNQPEFYIALANVLVGTTKQKVCSQDMNHDGRPRIAISALLETMWHTVFGEPEELPLREFDERLPDFLRAKEKYHQHDGQEYHDHHLSMQPQIDNLLQAMYEPIGLMPDVTAGIVS